MPIFTLYTWGLFDLNGIGDRLIALDILHNALKSVSPAKDDIAASQFDKIAAHIDREEIDQAVELLCPTFKEGNFDVRLIFYYLYAHFLQVGVMSFKETVPFIEKLVTEHWEILRPFQRKERQVDNSLNWYFTNVIHKLKYNERLYKKKKQLLGIFSNSHLSQADLDELLETLKRFMNLIHEKWEKSPIKERVGNLIKQINDLQPLLLQEQVAEVKLHDTIEEFEQQEAPENETAVQEDRKMALPASPAPEIESTPFETPAMHSLIKKLGIFEKLVEKGEFFKAAIVFSDISQVIAQFDPCAFFPKIFSSYLQLLARHSSSIADESCNQETLQWKSLERLFKADIDAFVGW